MPPADKASSSSKASSSKSGAAKSYRGVPRAKSGCYTCRIRRKKCDEQPDEHGRCATCVRLRLECLGFGAKRPEWLRDNRNVAEVREKIKVFLASQGMVKGYSGTTHQGFSFQEQQYFADQSDNSLTSQADRSSHQSRSPRRTPTPDAYSSPTYHYSPRPDNYLLRPASHDVSPQPDNYRSISPQPSNYILRPVSRDHSPEPDDHRPISPQANDYRPIPPQPNGYRPMSPRPDDYRPMSPHPNNYRPTSPHPNNYRPLSPQPPPDSYRAMSPRPNNYRPISPQPDNYRPISFGRGTQHLLNQDMVFEAPASPMYHPTPPIEHKMSRERDRSVSDQTSTSEISEYDKIEEITRRMEALFANKGEYRRVLSSRGLAAQRLLDMFQRLLDVISDPPPRFQRHLIVVTQRLAEKSGLYPECYELNGVTSQDVSEFSGGFADIYKGDFKGRAVCLKTVRLHRTADLEHFLKVISKEAILWGQLRHPNVLPFYGIYRFKNRVSFVAPWMENGDISEYLKRHQDSNRVVLSFDVAQGLQFLHKNEIIHGDLKGANILVNEVGRACIGDFGLSSVSDREILAMTSYSSIGSKGGTVRWQSPELFDPEGDEDIRNTEASDMYAWGCVAYEIFAGQVPFAHLLRDAVIITKVTGGERPAAPLPTSPSWGVWGLTEGIWSLMETCWQADPARRPTVGGVIEFLETVLPPGVEMDARDSSLSPGQFREMARRGMVESDLSVDALESLIPV